MEPALGDEGERVGEAGGVVVYGVDGGANVVAGGDVLIVGREATGGDLPPHDAYAGGGHAQGFLDAGPEVGAGMEHGTRFDLGEGGESGADFGCQGLVGGWIVGDIEEQG